MKISLFPTLKNYKKEYFGKDLTAGIMIAAVSIPISMALFVGLWLLLFYFLKAGKLVTFISTPVMGGFISGIALTIILMQIPKIMGGKSGSGELPELLKHLYETALHINWVSVGLGDYF